MHRILRVVSPAHSIAALPLSQVYLHPVAIAAWVGMFATALNLLPGGQLDGGHIVFSIAPRAHRWISRITIAALIPLAVYYWAGMDHLGSAAGHHRHASSLGAEVAGCGPEAPLAGSGRAGHADSDHYSRSIRAQLAVGRGATGSSQPLEGAGSARSPPTPILCATGYLPTHARA